MQTAEPWRTHDLRRTARTLMSRGGVSTEVAERMMCHLPHKLIRTYNVHDFAREKRADFEALEREIDLILHPPHADVLPFRGR